MNDHPLLAVIAGLGVGMTVIALFSIFFTSKLPIQPISDMELQDRMERTAEIKALYSRYPDLSVGFNRDDKIRTITFHGIRSEFPNGQGTSPQIGYSMQLAATLEILKNNVLDKFLVCTIFDGNHDPIQAIYYENIEQEIKSGDCLNVPIPDEWFVQPEPYNYRVSVGNKTFDVNYLFSSGIGSVKSIVVDPTTINIAVSLTIDTNASTLFSIKLPGQMLDQLQIESDLHYCVGNEFLVFVGDTYTDERMTKDGQDEIITVEVPPGHSNLQIIGEDLLYSPTMCP